MFDKEPALVWHKALEELKSYRRRGATVAHQAVQDMVEHSFSNGKETMLVTENVDGVHA